MDDVALVHIAVTFDKMSDLPKLSAQLAGLGAIEVKPEPSEHKIYGLMPAEQLHRLSLLRFAERSFLVLHRRFLDDDKDPVFAGDTSGLEDAMRTSDWVRAVACWSKLHGRAPTSWVADSKRTTATHKLFAAHGIDRLVLQHATRGALGELLSSRFSLRYVTVGADLSVVLHVMPHIATILVPMHIRRYRKGTPLSHKGLHHSLCWALGRIARLEPRGAEVVLDACCGTGSVLVEAASFWEGNAYLGADFDEKQCERARENAARVDELCVVRADATRLPFRTASVDVVLSDLPYGRQHGELSALADELYPAAVREASRVLRSGGRAVLLVEAAQAAPHLRSALDLEPCLRTVSAFETPGPNPRVPVSFFCLVRLPRPGEAAEAGGETVLVDDLGSADTDPSPLTRLFDLSFTDGDGERTWHDEKPSMDLYRPRVAMAS